LNTPFKLALIQMRVEAANKSANLRHASELISQAASQGAQVAVLPEAMPLGWTDPSARSQADEIPLGESCRCLQEAARHDGLYVCSGLVEKDGNQIFNAAVLIDPTGTLILHHRKLNELEIARGLYAQGDRLQVAHTPLGTFGVMICSDAFAPGQIISRTLGLMGAQVILSPCAWAVPADHDQRKEPYGKLWRDNYQPVARDFRLWIAGVSNVGWIPDGPWAGRTCIGCSLLVGPLGEVVLQGPYGHEAETILYVSMVIPPRPTQGIGWQGMESERTG
jgi:predicted amidohydrolase